MTSPKIQVRNDINAHRVVLDVQDGAVIIRMDPIYAVRVASALIEAAGKA